MTSQAPTQGTPPPPPPPPPPQTTTTTTSIPYPDLRIVFDFFTDNPQKLVPKKPVQQHNSLTSQNGYDNDGSAAVVVDPYWGSIRRMQGDCNFMEGMLLRCIDYKPQYPYLHYIVYNQPSIESLRLTDRRDVISRSSRSSGAHLDGTKTKGMYQEMCTYVTPHTPLLPKRPSNPNTAFSVSAFKTVGNLDSLDRNWTYWSGADYIVENIPKRLKLERVTFHKIRLNSCGGSFSYSDSLSLLGSPTSSSLQQPHQQQHHSHYQPQHSYNFHHSCNDNFNDDDSFSYVLLCEIGDALVDMNRTREFIDTLKYRQCGITSMCVIDHFF